MPIDEAGRFEIDFRLRQKEREFQQAILAANGVRIEALADDGVVVPGQPVQGVGLVANRGAADVNVKQVRFDGFSSDAACTLTAVTAAERRPSQGAARAAAVGPGRVAAQEGSGRALRADADVDASRARHRAVLAPRRRSRTLHVRRGRAVRAAVPADAVLRPGHADAWRATREEVVDGLPVQFRYEGNIFSGEKRAELLVVPALSVRVSPEIAIVPVASVPACRRAAAGAARRPRRGGRAASTRARFASPWSTTPGPTPKTW